ncbi:hypothetical protein LXL04_030931 [Taraxacum kok-saghyz]
MKSLHHRHPPPHSSLNHQHPPPRGDFVLQRHNFYLPINHVRTKTMAMSITTTTAAASHLVVLGANPPPAGDLTVLIPTSVGFLFLYWIANFVVPSMVMKDLESQDETNDQNPNDDRFM